MDSEYQIVCKTPLFQRVSLHAEISSLCDRFNMVKYIPELGLVVAASQKGRVAIISLTWHEEIGSTFRLDWIVPFSTQEAEEERPIIPLLGITVSPMPGFEIPQDVPSIPQGIDPTDWQKFNYRILNPDENESQPSPSPSPSSPAASDEEILSPSASTKPKHNTESGPHSIKSSTNQRAEKGDDQSDDQSTESGDSHSSKQTQGPKELTLPESHAQASRAYRPYEPWHGWHPSRHYRLLLLFCDHTVMSYEFWHDWKT